MPFGVNESSPFNVVLFQDTKKILSFFELSWVTELFLLEHHVTSCYGWQNECVQGWEVKVGSVECVIKP